MGTIFGKVVVRCAICAKSSIRGIWGFRYRECLVENTDIAIWQFNQELQLADNDGDRVAGLFLIHGSPSDAGGKLEAYEVLMLGMSKFNIHIP